MKYRLLLASRSSGRVQLLKCAGIHFEIIDQCADESVCSVDGPVEQVVSEIAVHKMDHVCMPTGVEGEVVLVLTADTLSVDEYGEVHGKPVDRADAIEKIKRIRGKGLVATGFCLDKKRYESGMWRVIDRRVESVVTRYVFSISDDEISAYLEHVPDYLTVSGAIKIEGYGSRFFKSLEGSYTGLLGLPVFEVVTAIHDLSLK